MNKIKISFFLSFCSLILFTNKSFALSSEVKEAIKENIAKYEKISVNNENITKLNCIVAGGYLDLQEYDNAIKYYKMAVELLRKDKTSDPKLVKSGLAMVLANLALAYVSDSKFEEAELAVNESISIDPSIPDSQGVLSLIYEHKGMTEKFNTLLKLNCKEGDDLSCIYLNDHSKKESFLNTYKKLREEMTEKSWQKKMKKQKEELKK